MSVLPVILGTSLKLRLGYHIVYVPIGEFLATFRRFGLRDTELSSKERFNDCACSLSMF